MLAHLCFPFLTSQSITYLTKFSFLFCRIVHSHGSNETYSASNIAEKPLKLLPMLYSDLKMLMPPALSIMSCTFWKVFLTVMQHKIIGLCNLPHLLAAVLTVLIDFY